MSAASQQATSRANLSTFVSLSQRDPYYPETYLTGSYSLQHSPRTLSRSLYLVSLAIHRLAVHYNGAFVTGRCYPQIIALYSPLSVYYIAQQTQCNPLELPRLPRFGRRCPMHALLASELINWFAHIFSFDEVHIVVTPLLYSAQATARVSGASAAAFFAPPPRIRRPRRTSQPTTPVIMRVPRNSLVQYNISIYRPLIYHTVSFSSRPR